jgi:hypothetical protein
MARRRHVRGRGWSYAARMAEKDYLGRTGGDGDSPEQKQSIADNVEVLNSTGQQDVQTDAPLGQQVNGDDGEKDDSAEQSGR